MIRPDHNNLAQAAITGYDSLRLQRMCPDVKPVVKMTFSEFVYFGHLTGNKALVEHGKAVYVVDVDAVGRLGLTVEQVKKHLREGKESALLGYPERTRNRAEMVDMAVTWAGDIVINLETMREKAKAHELCWAAEGLPGEVGRLALNVVKNIRSSNHEARSS